jgi:hypothetical protein
MNRTYTPPYVSHSEVLAETVDGAAFARSPLPTWVLQTLAYMSDIEQHTIAYLRELLSTPAVEDPEIAQFLACWFYEESAHGRALASVLDAHGYPASTSPRRPAGIRARLQCVAMATLSATWPSFSAVHMTWGAINELSTLIAYRQLEQRAAHPTLSALLARITRDESRHFGFYFEQARSRLSASRRTRLAVRLFVERFWAPVGSGVRPRAEIVTIAAALFSGDDGRAAARRIDRTVQRLPGLDGIPLVEAWMNRHVPAA